MFGGISVSKYRPRTYTHYPFYTINLKTDKQDTFLSMTTTTVANLEVSDTYYHRYVFAYKV